MGLVDQRSIGTGVTHSEAPLLSGPAENTCENM